MKVSDMKRDVYFAALSKLSLDDVKRACSKIIETCKFFPKPVEIIETVGGNPDNTALMEFLIFKKAVDRHGYYTTVVFNNPIIHAVVQALGGWVAVSFKTLDEWVWLEKDFVKLYKAFAERGLPKDVPLKLYGHHGLANFNRGFREGQSLLPEKEDMDEEYINLRNRYICGLPEYIGDKQKALAWTEAADKQQLDHFVGVSNMVLATQN